MWGSMEVRIERALQLGVQDIGRHLLRQTQARVPVVSGRLKASAYSTILPDGILIGYSSPYASNVEFGNKAVGGRLYHRKGVPGIISTATIFSWNPAVNKSLRSGSGRFFGPALISTLSAWPLLMKLRLQKELS